jgi:hypothetical protein
MKHTWNLTMRMESFLANMLPISSNPIPNKMSRFFFAMESHHSSSSQDPKYHKESKLSNISCNKTRHTTRHKMNNGMNDQHNIVAGGHRQRKERRVKLRTMSSSSESVPIMEISSMASFTAYRNANSTRLRSD